MSKNVQREILSAVTSGAGFPHKALAGFREVVGVSSMAVYCIMYSIDLALAPTEWLKHT